MTSLPSHAHPGRTAGLARVALGAVLLAAAMAGPGLASPAPAAAASCTGWTSKTDPPRTIKVLRTHTGRIETVDFRRYVAMVMASGEWPTALRKATLEAGAVATKQYAWYYALKGNHRPGYTRAGRCYDVRDDTADQLYRPERAAPTDKQLKAVRRTWALSLRKGGSFFLTGYRTGAPVDCGEDANGWKLYMRSVQVCANKGLDYKQILRTYLDPRLSFVWSADAGPQVSRPVFNLKAGTTWDDGIATVTWKPVRGSHTVARYQLQRKTGNGPWRSVKLASATTRQTTAWVRPAAHSQFRVRATDRNGRHGRWAYSRSRKAALRGPVGTSLSGTDDGPADLIKVTTRFDGRSIALMSRTGPQMGVVRVLVNGRQVATVDLARAGGRDRVVVWARNFGRARPRVVTVQSADPSARADFQGFFVLR